MNTHHHSGSYLMTPTSSQESNSSTNSSYTRHSHSSHSTASPSQSPPSTASPPSYTHSYNHHPTTYGSPAPSGSNTGNPPRHPCLYPGCSHSSARLHDLERHMRTHYSETVPRRDCPYASGGFCGREGKKGFTREDHRKEHVRKVHPVKAKSGKGEREGERGR